MMSLIVSIVLFLFCLLPAGIAYVRERMRGSNQTPDWQPPLQTGLITFVVLEIIYFALIKGVTAGMLVDYWNYLYMGVPNRWITETVTGVALWFVGFVVSLLVFWLAFAIGALNVQIVPPRYSAKRQADESARKFTSADAQWKTMKYWINVASAVVLVIAAIIFASWLSAYRFDVQQGLWGKLSNKPDPINGLDSILFYDFQLTLLRDCVTWLFWLVAFAIAFAVAGVRTQFERVSVYSRETDLSFNTDTLMIRVMNAVKALIAFTLLLASAYSALMRYLILINGNSDVVGGAGYVDITFAIPNYTILAVILAVCALILFVFPIRENTTTRSLWITGSISIGTPIMYWLLVIAIVGSINQYRVEQRGLELERKYVGYKLENTDWAFGLNNVQYVTDLQFVDSLSPQELAANADVLDQARVLDYTLLTAQNNALETQTFYSFNDVDVINQDGVIYMGSVREIDLSALPDGVTPWVRDHLRFTHGYGHVLVDSSTVKADGAPLYVVKNKPPEGPDSLLVEEDGNYFGEKTSDYIIVNTTVMEYDYTIGEGYAESRYKGTAGVPLDSFWRKFIFAVYFDEPKILLSPMLTSESRIIYFRSIGEIAKRLLPESTTCDGDPYWTMNGFEKVWILQCFSRSNKVPYSEHVSDLDPSDSFLEKSDDNNYYRVAYTITVGQYSGEWNVYRMDEDDAISQTWASVYPDVFKSMSAMPEYVVNSLRWPDDMKVVQDTIFKIHHNITEEGYFTREQSSWERVKEADNFNSAPQYAAPRFVQMRLPHQDAIEYVSTSYFTSKNSMPLIAGLYARNIPGHYGELVAIKLPANENVLGFENIAPKVQDEIGTWINTNTGEGKTVINGDNVLIPVYGNNDTISFVFVNGVFLEVSGQVKLNHVFVINGSQTIEYNETLQQALAQIYSDSAGTWQELAIEAYNHYIKARECFGAGDWICYQQEQSAFEHVFDSLQFEANTP